MILKMEDKMMQKYFRKRCYTLVIVFVISMFTFTACGSKEESEATKETVDVAVEETVVEAVDVESEETVSEEGTIVETTVEETTKELYIPEGIDMESTLPGEEWVASFIGNVNEPVVVIYNDNTGRKEVVQAESEVIINPDEDRIAAYWPEISMGYTTHAISKKDRIRTANYEISIMDSDKMRTITERPAKVTVMGGAEDWVLEFTIIVE